MREPTLSVRLVSVFRAPAMLLLFIALKVKGVGGCWRERDLTNMTNFKQLGNVRRPQHVGRLLSLSLDNGRGEQFQHRLYFNVHRNLSAYLSKGTEIPLQAWTGPEGSRRLRLPDFKIIGT
jgi:hypothetical protein